MAHRGELCGVPNRIHSYVSIPVFGNSEVLAQKLRTNKATAALVYCQHAHEVRKRRLLQVNVEFIGY